MRSYIMLVALAACDVKVTATAPQLDKPGDTKPEAPKPSDPVATEPIPSDPKPRDLHKPWAAFMDAPVTLAQFSRPKDGNFAQDLQRLSIVNDATNFTTRTVYFEYLDHAESGCFSGIYDTDYGAPKDVTAACQPGPVRHRLSDWQWDNDTVASVNVCIISAATGQVTSCKRIEATYVQAH